MIAHSRAFHFLTEAYGVSEVVVAFGGIDGFDQAAGVSLGIFDGSLLSGTHPVFDLGESLLDRIEVG